MMGCALCIAAAAMAVQTLSRLEAEGSFLPAYRTSSRQLLFMLAYHGRVE
jgi:hypothetical protein